MQNKAVNFIVNKLLNMKFFYKGKNQERGRGIFQHIFHIENEKITKNLTMVIYCIVL